MSELKKIVINVDLVLNNRNPEFAELLSAILEDKKDLMLTDSLNLWDYDPQAVFQSVVVSAPNESL